MLGRKSIKIFLGVWTIFEQEQVHQPKPLNHFMPKKNLACHRSFFFSITLSLTYAHKHHSTLSFSLCLFILSLHLFLSCHFSSFFLYLTSFCDKIFARSIYLFPKLSSLNSICSFKRWNPLSQFFLFLKCEESTNGCPIEIYFYFRWQKALVCYYWALKW